MANENEDFCCFLLGKLKIFFFLREEEGTCLFGEGTNETKKPSIHLIRPGQAGPLALKRYSKSDPFIKWANLLHLGPARVLNLKAQARTIAGRAGLRVDLIHEHP